MIELDTVLSAASATLYALGAVAVVFGLVWYLDRDKPEGGSGGGSGSKNIRVNKK